MNQSDVHITFLLADKNEFSGVCFQKDTLLYTSEPNSYDMFNNCRRFMNNTT